MFTQPLLQWKSNNYYVFWGCACSLRYPCAILSSVACPALHSFSALSHKCHDVRNHVIERKICALIFSTKFVWNTSYSKKNWARYYHKCLHIFLSDFKEIWIFSKKFRMILKYQNSWKSVQCKPICSMHREGRTDRWTADMTKLIVTFRNFANVLKDHEVNHSQEKRW